MKTSRMLGVALVALPLAALGAEALVRIRAHARFGAALDIYDLHRRLPENGLLVPMPDLDLEFAGTTRIQTDERGFRSPPVAVPKPAGTLRLAFLGESTTFCSQASSNAHTWPQLVQRELQARLSGLSVDHVNAGVTSYRMKDTQLALALRVAEVEPDVLVIYLAANDLAEDTHALAVAAGLAEPAHVPGWLERHSLLWKLVRKNRDFVRAQRSGRGTEDKLDCDLDALAAGFEERLVGLVERGKGIADLVVLVTFATKFRRDQPLEVQLAHMEQSFTFMSYLTAEDLHRGFEAYNGAIVRAARRTGALLIDGHEDLQGEAAFFADSVHFSDQGCEAMAHRVTQQLLAAERFLALADETRASGNPR